MAEGQWSMTLSVGRRNLLTISSLPSLQDTGGERYEDDQHHGWTLNYDEKLTIGAASTFAPSPAPPVELEEKGGMGLEDDWCEASLLSHEHSVNG